MSPKLNLFNKIQYLKGVGPARADLFARLGIKKLYDLLFHLPRGYEDRRRITPIRELQEGESAVVAGRVTDINLKKVRSGNRILEVYVSDGAGIITLIWFHAKPSWAENFSPNSKITAFGKVTFYKGPQIVSPDYAAGDKPELSPKFGCIQPIYPSTEGLSQKLIRTAMQQALEAADELADALPRSLAIEKGFESKPQSLRKVHFPDNLKAAETARRRLAYEELLIFQTTLAVQRQLVKSSRGYCFKTGRNVERRIRRLFPFRFTQAQDRVIAEMRSDLHSRRPMHRLLQGDVGCGKTVVAVYALLSAMAERSKEHQAAFMAPTEVLAEQHYLTLERLLAKTNVRITLLKGSSSTSERTHKLRSIEKGEVDLVIGTHALIEQDVIFKKLALAVIDEQHRFGVRQRLDLTRKGRRPDVLLMTATPIPRTMTLACFGDMDVSTIKEMPPGRQSIHTSWVAPSKWNEAYGNSLKELRAGRQVFVIFPLVEANDELDLKSATEAYEELQGGIFRDFRCCLMHGQMPAESKRKAMEGFRKGDFQVMVATTVIEVGIDVPNAAVMIIQHAERLGLSQLHQLRGRIGRGKHPGSCYLLAHPTTEEARARLEVISSTTDGFKIAEADLRLRGPGELFGTRQSGMPEFRCYDFSDLELLNESRNDAFAIIKDDPDLSSSGNTMLKKAIKQRYSETFALGRIG